MKEKRNGSHTGDRQSHGLGLGRSAITGAAKSPGVHPTQVGTSFRGNAMFDMTKCGLIRPHELPYSAA